jgi:hypothetical protein
MPDMPHESVVRGADNEAAYVALFTAIREQGVFEQWAGHYRRYLYTGDSWRYWAMTTEVREGRVINRERIKDHLERLPREAGLGAETDAGLKE